MYNNFFGLSEEPFGVTPDPKFLFVSRKHEEAIAALNYGIAQGRGFIMLTGEVGSGKTTVIRHVFQSFEPEVRTAMVLNPKMDAMELLGFINQDFGLPSPPREATHKTLMDDLNGFLLECHRAGGRAVLAIDEAQEMSAECLEFVRLLSNLETDTKKLIQIILVGQPELRVIVRGERLRQLDQRIAVRYHIEPLDADETAKYIKHRLKMAGSTTVIFPDKGVKAIHRASRGVPRLINLACDRALLASFANGELQIRKGRIKEVLREFAKEQSAGADIKADITREKEPAGKKLSLRPAIAGLGVLLVFALFLYGGVEEKRAARLGESPEETAPHMKPAANAEVQPGPDVFVKDGLYMARGAARSEEASLMNLLQAWGEKGLDGSSPKEALSLRGYATYRFEEMEKIEKFGTPVVLSIEESGSVRHVALRWVVGDYAVVEDPLNGKQIVPFAWLKEKAAEAMLIYKNAANAGEPNEKALAALLSSGPSLTP